jgi:hypothetical protein
MSKAPGRAARTAELDALVLRWLDEMPDDFRARVLDRLDGYPDPARCWMWTGARTGAGDGRVMVPRAVGLSAQVSVSRAMRIAVDGAVPDGFVRSCELDPLCMQPAHKVVVPSMKREQTYSWRGDDADTGYRNVHLRMGDASAHACAEGCGRQAAHWSYDGKDPDERRDDRGRRYSLKPNHYLPRCVPCHQWLDHARDRCTRGHGPEHWVVDEERHRRYCTECRREDQRTTNAMITRARQELGLTWEEYERLFKKGRVTAECVLWAAEACAAAVSAD